MVFKVSDRILTELNDTGSALILGFGKEGRSTYDFIKRNFPAASIGIADRDLTVKDIFRKDYPVDQVEFFLGGHYLEAVDQYPIIVKSPGVALPENISPAARKRVTSQADQVLKAFHRQVIGVTGTKGKSTTSSLVHHLVKEAGKDSILVGNIGVPPFDLLHKASPGTLIVFELSSHQLEDSMHAPFIAVLTNLYPEHLDRYASLDDYYNAKMKILSGQETGDTFIYNEDIPEIAHRVAKLGRRRNYLSYSSGIQVRNGCHLENDTIFLSQQGTSEPYVEITEKFSLRGKHNRMNMMAAILAARTAGIPDEDIRKGLETFKGLEHRLEYVGKYGGIEFFNDSIATIPEAAMAAVKSLPDTDTMILGGYDRGLEYGPLVDFLRESQVRNFIFLGEAGRRMMEMFSLSQASRQRLYSVASLEAAFKVIAEVTEPGKICLLSPAAASYDIFKNFEERGHVFKKLARSL